MSTHFHPLLFARAGKVGTVRYNHRQMKLGIARPVDENLPASAVVHTRRHHPRVNPRLEADTQGPHRFAM